MTLITCRLAVPWICTVPECMTNALLCLRGVWCSGMWCRVFEYVGTGDSEVVATCILRVLNTIWENTPFRFFLDVYQRFSLIFRLPLECGRWIQHAGSTGLCAATPYCVSSQTKYPYLVHVV